MDDCGDLIRIEGEEEERGYGSACRWGDRKIGSPRQKLLEGLLVEGRYGRKILGANFPDQHRQAQLAM